MREKKRYMTYEIVSAKPLEQADKALLRKLRDLLGVFMSAQAGLVSVKYHPGTQRGVLRVNKKFTDYVRSCFVMIKNLNKQKVLIRTLRISGAINKAKKELKD